MALVGDLDSQFEGEENKGQRAKLKEQDGLVTFDCFVSLKRFELILYFTILSHRELPSL